MNNESPNLTQATATPSTAAEVMTADGCPAAFIHEATTTVATASNTAVPSTVVAAAERELNEISERLTAGHHRAERGNDEWVEGSLEMASALAEGRERFKSDIAFGAWLTGRGHNFLNKDDRAALINLGRNITTARVILEATQSRSYRLIWREEARFRSTAKPTSRHKHTRTKPSAAADEITERMLRKVELNADFGATSMVPEPPVLTKNCPAKLDPRSWNAASPDARAAFVKLIDPVSLFDVMPENWVVAARAWIHGAPAPSSVCQHRDATTKREQAK